MRQPSHIGAELFEGGVTDVALFDLFGVLTALMGRHQHLAFDP
jgi:hypothetical protein